MLVQILTQAMSHVQLITAILLLAAVVLQLVHIGQTRRINKKLSNAGRWLQRYLNAVFQDEEDAAGQEEVYLREEAKERAREVEAQLTAQPLQSRQEENMRSSLENKKQKKDEELLDTVLQEIFD